MKSSVLIMGVLNMTPDSFSDGGRFDHIGDAIDAGMRMIDEGADIVDVGGESTRPGSEPVGVDEELRRTISVVAGLASRGVRVSIDTMKSKVAREALLAGAEIVNDITALRHPEMRQICAEADCTVCLMHMQGEPKTMQIEPQYVDVVAEVREFLIVAADRAQSAGVRAEKLWLDPGIGFGKSQNHNLVLLRNLETFVDLGYPILVGVSRKSFVGRITGVDQPDQRNAGTLAAQVLSQVAGARIIRTHDVREARQAVAMTSAILSA